MKRTPQYMSKSVKRLCLLFPIIVSEEILITDLPLILHICKYFHIYVIFRKSSEKCIHKNAQLLC